MRRRRRLSGEEQRLWEQVAGSVRPLDPMRAIAEAAPEPAPEPPPMPPAPAVPATAAPPEPPKAPGLASIDRRTWSRLARGALPIAGRLDLHGLTQQDAHRRLKRFLAETQAADGRLVLVITGKGLPNGEFASERGVLRRAVPHWLAAPEFRSLVTGFEEAHRSHGGSGALYVRVRRRRES